MDDTVFEDIEVAPHSVVLVAAREFAASLADTPQFKAFEQVAERFRSDQEAHQAQKAFQEKQISWKALIMLNALTPEQHAELESLHSAFVNQPIMKEYINAQTELVALSQIVGDTLSEAIGFNFAAACGVSCCG
jgi:cell fate (sporulation/competence/biofilm development) regulator YlbF (YheA/YmcA/DUF963 family)